MRLQSALHSPNRSSSQQFSIPLILLPKGGDVSGEALLRSNVAGDGGLFWNQRLCNRELELPVVGCKMAKEMEFKDRIKKIAASTNQL
jgi:hypothetical protein